MRAAKLHKGDNHIFARVQRLHYLVVLLQQSSDNRPHDICSRLGCAHEAQRRSRGTAIGAASARRLATTQRGCRSAFLNYLLVMLRPELRDVLRQRACLDLCDVQGYRISALRHRFRCTALHWFLAPCSLEELVGILPSAVGRPQLVQGLQGSAHGLRLQKRGIGHGHPSPLAASVSSCCISWVDQRLLHQEDWHSSLCKTCVDPDEKHDRSPLDGLHHRLKVGP
mmetsp:Transcript_4147/g.6592  ORF Transcript_4147/g.6592 Transcript_4147/m.6592 type:complete len:225 (+) Transcript_4147:1707-2381(+)